jgi:pSer/pThr/pTyr-binding forkhead associated (FHA) protein
MIFILVILFLLLLSILLMINMMRLKKKRSISKGRPKQNGHKLKEETSKIAATLDPKKTNYGSITPYITIELDGQFEKFDLKKLRTTIGRHSDNDILIANLTISNHHATVTNEGGVFYIQDNDSTNGTFVNDIKITKTSIKPEDSVRLGKAKLHLTY